MVNKKQLDRLTLKISRLLDVYSEYLVIECEEQEVLLDGERIRLGERWGKEFGYGNFTFRYRRRLKNPYLFVNDGGVEHLVKADGKPFGMIDWLEQGKDAIFRCHKYVSLTDIPDGAEITIEAYASHTFYGTNAPSPHKEFITNNVKERLKHIKKFDLTKMETALPNDTILGNLDTEELRLSKIHYDEKLVTELAKALARYFKEHFDKIGEE